MNNDQNTEAQENLAKIRKACYQLFGRDVLATFEFDQIETALKAQARSEVADVMCLMKTPYNFKGTAFEMTQKAAIWNDAIYVAQRYFTEQREAGWRPLCHSIDFGTYDNAVAIQAPWGELITLDICVIPEIKWLWDNGVRTTGSCCGHGDRSLAVICADDNSQSKMEKLGYKPHPKAPHCYISKTAPPPAEESEG